MRIVSIRTPTSSIRATVFPTSYGAPAHVLSTPSAVAVDGANNVFIAETGRHRVLRVATGTNAITTVAGNGQPGFAGDNGPATAAMLNVPFGVAVDSSGNVSIADSLNHRIRRVSSGTITTVVETNLSGPRGVAVDGGGVLWIADTGNHRVQKLSPRNGIITVAGDDPNRMLGDFGFAQAATLNSPAGIAVDSTSSLVFADVNNNRIRKVDAPTRIISTLAGNGQAGFSGDSAIAGAATLAAANGVAVDAGGNIFIADTNNNRIRRIAAESGVITTVAGNGQSGFSGDGSAATSASLRFPASIAVDTAGNLYVADTFNNRIRKVAAGSGLITTVAGNGQADFSGDDGPATSASLRFPLGVAVDSSGNVFIADTSNHRIRKVTASSGIITTVGGTGQPGFGGDFGPATAAVLNSPSGVAIDPANNILVADTLNQRIRRIAGMTSTMTTLAGNGIAKFSGDGGAALDAILSFPGSVGIDAEGNIFFTDRGNDRIRAIRGQITSATFANCEPIVFGQPINGSLSVSDTRSSNRTGRYADCYSFSARAGDRISIALNSTAFDSYLNLLNSSNQITAFNDDVGSGVKNARIPQSGMFVIPVEGTYLVEATSFSADSTGNYALTLTREGSPPAPACASITIGSSANGSLTPEDGQSRNRPGSYADCYSFSGNAGDRISFSMTSSAFDSVLYLSNAAETLLSSNDDGGSGTNAAGSFVLPATGAYVIEGTSFDPGSVGSYVFTLTRISSIALPTCNSITLGATVNGSLQSTDGQSRNRASSYADCYTFTGNAGERISITMTSSAFDPYVYLSTTGDALVASDDDGAGGSNSRIPATGTLTLPGSGTYTIEATSFAPSSGNYSLIAVRDASTSEGCTPLSYGQTTTGALSTTDTSSRNRTGRYADCFTFFGNSGDRIAIALSSTSFDTYMYLMNASGQVVISDDDGGGGSNSRVPAASGTFLLTATGTYTIETTSLALAVTGNYSLTLTRAGTSTTPACSSITYGQTLTGALATTDGQSVNRAGSFADCFTFAGSAGDRISIGLNSAAFDTYLYLMNAAGQILMEDDDGGDGANSRIPIAGSFKLPATGNYTIEATSFGPTLTGNYSVNLTRDTSSTAPACATVTIGQTVSGNLASTDGLSTNRPGRYADCFTFTGAVGDRLIISMNSTGVDAFLNLLGPGGEVVASDDESGGDRNARIPAAGSFEVKTAGTYTIEATSYGAGETGNYSLAVARETAASVAGCTAISYGQTIDGTLSSTDPSSRFGANRADCFAFSGNAGEQIALTMNSTAIDAYLRLMDAAGQILAFNDDLGDGTNNSRIAFTLPASGTYLIEATSLDGSLGTYTINLTKTGP